MRVKKWPNGYPGLGAVEEAPAPCGGCKHDKALHHTSAGGCLMEGCSCKRWKAPHTPHRTVSDRSDTVRLPLGSAEEWVGKKPGAKSKKKATSASKKQVDRAVDAFEILWKARAWDEMQAQHFLGLYVVCHRKVYGTDPADLFAAWTGALGAVRATLKHEFGDSPSRMVSFLQWAWGREQQREKQRRNNGGDFRLSWRFLFVRQAAAGNLTDWRTSLARAAQTRSGIKAAQ